MNSSKKPIARIDATIIPHCAMVKGFVNTALTEVRMATGTSTSRSRSNGNETTLMLRATTAKTNPIAVPNPINFQPCGVPRILAMNCMKDSGGVDPKSAT